MNRSIIKKSFEIENKRNSKILAAFIKAYCNKSAGEIKNILDDNGKYFDGMNKEMALDYFLKIFNGPNGIKNKYHIVDMEGITCDFRPGEIMLEIRCSDLDFFESKIPWRSKNFGEQIDKEINEIVHQFAFTFRNDKIFTIRKPKKSISLDSPIIYSN
jgi:hypothetical protein